MHSPFPPEPELSQIRINDARAKLPGMCAGIELPFVQYDAEPLSGWRGGAARYARKIPNEANFRSRPTALLSPFQRDTAAVWAKPELRNEPIFESNTAEAGRPRKEKMDEQSQFLRPSVQPTGSNEKRDDFIQLRKITKTKPI